MHHKTRPRVAKNCGSGGDRTTKPPNCVLRRTIPTWGGDVNGGDDRVGNGGNDGVAMAKVTQRATLRVRCSVPYAPHFCDRPRHVNHREVQVDYQGTQAPRLWAGRPLWAAKHRTTLLPRFRVMPIWAIETYAGTTQANLDTLQHPHYPLLAQGRPWGCPDSGLLVPSYSLASGIKARS